MTRVRPYSIVTEQDVFRYQAGKHRSIYNCLGARMMEVEGETGVYFAVWAPNAKTVSVFGTFNDWHRETHCLFPRTDYSGIWEGFIPGIEQGAAYKYAIQDRYGRIFDKGDPYATHWETPPNTASKVWNLDYEWSDGEWMQKGRKREKASHPLSIYEVHLGSWKQKVWEGKSYPLTYRELAEELVAYVAEMGFTHVELMPVMEHPYAPSWGYQITGYYAPTSRFGTPQDLMHLIDAFHQAGIGVILDWVPSHFPTDGHGLSYFDGTHLYEHADPRKGYHPDWTSYIFDYSRHEVRSFLISNALFWLKKYHVDGLRVDAVASMIYLDYSREEGEWVPNIHGGRENLEAISLLQELNDAVRQEMPSVLMIAEESTAYPGITHQTVDDGMGFDFKWMMGWMNDTLEYFKMDPLFRKEHQHQLTFSISYAYSEKFILPLSHDEVVHGKASLIGRMPGKEWDRFANLRLLYTLMFAHPGGQLLFMGGEIGQTSEWNFKTQLDWHLLQYDLHKGIQTFVKELNRLFTSLPALYQLQHSPTGFEWIAGDDVANSVITFLRKGKSGTPTMLVVLHFTPVYREGYQVGVQGEQEWEVVLNSDAEQWGGKGKGPQAGARLTPSDVVWHGKTHSLQVDLPPLGGIWLVQK